MTPPMPTLEESIAEYERIIVMRATVLRVVGAFHFVQAFFASDGSNPRRRVGIEMDARIADHQLAWVLTRARDGLIGRVPLHTMICVDAGLEAMRAGDVVAFRDYIARGREGFTSPKALSWSHFRERKPDDGIMPYPDLVWCVGRPTPCGEIDWCAGGSILNRESFYLYRGAGHRGTSRIGPEAEGHSIFDKRITTGSFIWRLEDFPLDVELGVTEVSDCPQPFVSQSHLLRAPLWCAACDRWVDRTMGDSPCSHIWWCSAHKRHATREPRNLEFNRKDAVVRCGCCTDGWRKAKNLPRVPASYVPNCGDRKAFA